MFYKEQAVRDSSSKRLVFFVRKLSKMYTEKYGTELVKIPFVPYKTYCTYERRQRPLFRGASGQQNCEGFFFRSEKTFMLSFSDFIRFSVAIFPGMFLSRVYDKLLYNLGHQVVKKVVSKSSICLLEEHGSAAQRSRPGKRAETSRTREGQLTCFPARGREGDELFPWDLISLSPSCRKTGIVAPLLCCNNFCFSAVSTAARK